MALFAKMIILFVALFVGVGGQTGLGGDGGSLPSFSFDGGGEDGGGGSGNVVLPQFVDPSTSQQQVGVTAQSACRPLELPRGFSSRSSVFFDTFEAQGVMEGIVAVQGNAVLSDISIGSQVTDKSLPAFMVAGNLEFRCGSLHGNLFYGGTSHVGPRVDNNGYALDRAVIANIYDHLFAFQHYSLISEEVFKVQSALGGGMSSLQGNVLRLVGGNRPTEVFQVSCSDLNAAQTVWFQQVTNTPEQPLTIIINVVSSDSNNADQAICKMDFSRIDGYMGLDFSDRGSHIIWNFPSAVTIELYQTVLGSILAPLADIQAHDSVVEGQIIANSLNGSIFGILAEFSGCLPTDPCHVLREDCVVASVMPSGCIEGTVVVDPERGCCEVWECKESCADKSIPCETVEEQVCPGNTIPVISVRAGSSEASDPCCDVYQCVSPECPNDICTQQPLMISCPDDITITLPVSESEIFHQVDRGQFLFAQEQYITRVIYKSGTDGWGVVSCPSPSCYLQEGLYLVMNKVAAPGLEPIYCNYEIKIRPDPFSSGGCVVGGVNYDDGEEARDSCNRVCLCVNGDLKHCARERPELQTMSLDNRQLYFQTFKAVYNQEDGLLKSMIDNHVQFFSQGLHNSGTFLPWHRGYLLQLENLLNQVDCRVTLARWNWMLQPRVLTANIWGNELHQVSGSSDPSDSDRCIKGGNFGEETFLMTNNRCLQRRISGSSTTTSSALQSGLMSGRYILVSNFDSFRNRLEHGPGMHDSVHCLVGGTMCSARSSNDPVFWSHHANIDWIWSKWQKLSNAHKFKYVGTTDIDTLMPTSPYTPRDMLDMNSLEGHIVIYAEADVTTSLTLLLESMTPEELSSIGNVGVGAAGKEWLDAMDMPVAQQTQIHSFEDLANEDIVQEAIAMTLRNGVERGFQMPGLEEATLELMKRFASTDVPPTQFIFDQSVATGGIAHIELIWMYLQQMFVAQNIVPDFLELQDILIEFVDDEGSTQGFETVTVSATVECVSGHPVCGNGINFPNECVAHRSGVQVTSDGLCALPPSAPNALSPDIDNGASADYNHQIQELSECPDDRPLHGDACSIDHVVCYYGISCCALATYEITTTCNAGFWFVVQYQWNGDCAEALCGLEKSESSATVPPPTDQPTRRPTATTRTPTRRPTPPPTFPRAIPQPSPPVSRGTVSQSAWGVSEPRRNNRRTSVVVFPTSSTTRPVLVTQPTTGITNSPCATVRCGPPPICCESGSSIEEHVVGGCSQCLTCISDDTGLPTVVPACCSVSPTCTVPECDSGEVANLMNDVGPDGTTPCCPRYQCHCPACPSLADASCIDGRVPRFASLLLNEVALDNTGCRECRIIRCVVDFCPGHGLPHECSDGTFVHKNPASIPACEFHACQKECPNPTEIRYCPAPGGGLIVRFRHMVPSFLCPFCPEKDELVCPWDPCPDYEPCDDELLGQRLCNGNGRCQPGNPRRIVCVCNSDWNGEFCSDHATPPRIIHQIYTRSFLYAPGFICKAFMCYPSESGRGCYVGFAENRFKDWLLIPGAHTILGFEDITNNAYWATDEGYLMVTPFNNQGIDLSLTRMGDEADELVLNRNGILVARSDSFSYRKVVNNELPPPSEYTYVINSEFSLNAPETWETQDCHWWIYLTEENVVFYHASNGLEIMVKTSWFLDQQGNSFLTSTETMLCEDLCNGETCDGHGVCDRTTGSCRCYFGFYGDRCWSTNSEDAITEWD